MWQTPVLVLLLNTKLAFAYCLLLWWLRTEPVLLKERCGYLLASNAAGVSSQTAAVEG